MARWQPKTRGGYNYHIFGEMTEPMYVHCPIIGEIEVDGLWRLEQWGSNGKNATIWMHKRDYDLIPVFEINELDYYRMRDGRKAYIGWIDTVFGRKWPCVGIQCCSPDDMSCWTRNGFWGVSEDENDLDIVAKWDGDDE